MINFKVLDAAKKTEVSFEKPRMTLNWRSGEGWALMLRTRLAPLLGPIEPNALCHHNVITNYPL